MKTPRVLSALLLSSITVLTLGCSDSKSSGDGHSNGAPAGGARFFLPTGEPDNTSAPAVEVDRQGGTHAVYPAYAIGGAYYAYCGPGCTSDDETQVVRFETEGTTTNALLALDAAGHPHLLLSAYSTLYYGHCETDCGTRASWDFAPIFEHDSERDVTGEAFTLDPEGHPRFLMHTRIAYLGIGQKEPNTRLVGCDADCTTPSSWTSNVIAQEIWQGSHLRYDSNGTIHVATVITAKEGGLAEDTAAYLNCSGDCTTEDAWDGIGLGTVYQSEYEAVTIKPTLSMALSSKGTPRIVYLGATASGDKQVLYFECDTSCRQDNWRGIVIAEGDHIDAGLDLALDAEDHARVAVTMSYNIGLLACDEPGEGCTAEGATWDLAKVEAGDDMPPDQIMPYPNCTVGMWFLHSPSLALTASGEPRVGYQARDISGGTTNPDPNSRDCVAGTDMTFSRLALLSSVR